MKSRSFAQIHGSLILVNRDHPFRCDIRPELAAPDPVFPAIRMERCAALLLNACIRKAGAAGQIIPVSGWRSRQEQQQIWDDTMEKEGEIFTRQYVAFPGCSEHESGLAIDLAKSAPKIDFIRPELPYDGVYGTFRHLAPRYGFIERYQADKQNITGIAPEPWHFRYVGIPHALLMESHQLCLEEYIALLHHQELGCTLANGSRVRVRWFDERDLQEQVTRMTGTCQLSSDNAGGIIVTQWEGNV